MARKLLAFVLRTSARLSRRPEAGLAPRAMRSDVMNHVGSKNVNALLYFIIIIIIYKYIIYFDFKYIILI